MTNNRCDVVDVFRVVLPLIAVLIQPLPELSCAADTSTHSVSDIVCGPRCCVFIVTHYKRTTDGLANIVRRMQWPDIQAGVTLQAIQTELEKNDIACLGVRMPSCHRLKWDHPVVVQLHDTKSIPEGHFVIWLPDSRRDRECIWDGLNGVQYVDGPTFRTRMSDVVLLTSPKPLTQPVIATARASAH